MKNFFDPMNLNWEARLNVTVEVMKELSCARDPQAMNQVYARRMSQLFPTDRIISLSRRGLNPPAVKVTRYNLWPNIVNPWKENGKLPIIEGGFFGELIYNNAPVIIDELKIPPDDPAAEYLENQQSLLAIPQYDQGEALNMVIATREMPFAFPHERFPDLVWMSNLFGRATQTSVLTEKLQEAKAASDFEIQTIGRMQHALLQTNLPKIPTLDLAVHYQTSSKAGGDYYDVFPLPKDRWGILIADVSGHGTSAAVLMAVVHSLAKTYTGPPWPTGLLLSSLNQHLARHFTRPFGSFVTAFHAVYDPNQGTLHYANAGHIPPRLFRCSTQERLELGSTPRLPLGITEKAEYPEQIVELTPGDQVLFFTDGVIEATNSNGDYFGIEGIDNALSSCPVGAQAMLDSVLKDLAAFTNDAPPSDDRTLLAAKFMRLT
ncbi:serine/threonine-protein phosphatase [Telmatocola sphagniphila]|uniref:Serine/threonine-protein phosphatase n=1 Tax=Telmatocola sphagniphila TaxID=1123043 RepID=A0A8E6ETT8_9BACT|nr:PP2C family protein-serine/threonine phosphatase [Telmatocola sphagniphila]QVL30535.1 serine/threonine-protein phosphatase [Telmatocola sphagniphila]